MHGPPTPGDAQPGEEEHEKHEPDPAGHENPLGRITGKEEEHGRDHGKQQDVARPVPPPIQRRHIMAIAGSSAGRHRQYVR